MELKLTLPWPPSANRYKKVGRITKTKTGKIYQQRVNTDETKTFYFQVYMLTKQKIPQEWARIARDSSISYKVEVYLYPPDNRRYDLDNRLKVLLDSLVRAHVINDDSQISKLLVEKMASTGDAKVIVRIRELI